MTWGEFVAFVYAELAKKELSNDQVDALIIDYIDIGGLHGEPMVRCDHDLLIID